MKIRKAISGKEICKIIMDEHLQEALANEGDWVDYVQYDKEKFKSPEEYMESLNLVNFEFVEGVCNSDELYQIVYFKDQNVYIKITGTYDSYDGYDHDYDDKVIEVFPKQKQIIVYEENI